MGIILKFEKGARSLDLTTGRYRVRPDFKPPATAVTAFYASGTNRNRHGGGNRVGNKANNTQWGFTVDCKGDTEAEVNRAVGNLTAFLKMAGDEIEPLYLAFRGNTDIASEPTWGQYGANMRFEIVNSQTPQIDPVYGKGRVRQAMARVSLSLTIKPYAYGVRQKLAKGLGGIAEYKVGSFDGRSRGIAVPVAITNRVTNPVFGTRSAIVNWGSGWNTGADLIMERCVDPEYTIEAYGGASVRLTMHADTGDALFDQALVNNAGHFSFYAKMLNGEEITASHIAIAVTSGSSITTNIEGVGDGWHYVWGEVAAFSPPGPTAVMGVELQAIGTVVHVTGFQLEDGGYAPTPLAYGDLLGCDWSSTAHLSTTTRDVAELNLDVTGFYSSNIYSDGQGTIRMAVEATSNSTDVPAAEHFFFTTDQTTGNLELRYYGSGANTLGLYGKGGAAVSDTLAFSHGDIIVIHAVWGSGGMHLYVNGVAHGTSDTYDPGSALTETLHIGHDGTVSGKQCGHIIKDFTIWTEPATAAEVLADYTNLLPILTDGEVLSPLPYAWDKDGDGIVDNAYDSTRSNHMIASGIAGDAPARTTMVIQKDSGEDDESIWFSNFVTSRFVDPSIYMKEFQGTVDANASEGEYEAITVGTTVVNETITNSWGGEYDELWGKSVYFFARFHDEGSDLQLGGRYTHSSLSYIESEMVDKTTAASWRLYRTPLMHISDIRDSNPRENSLSFTGLQFNAIRTTGSDDIRLDYTAIMVDPMRLTSNTGALTARFVYDSDRPTYFYNIVLGSIPVARDPLSIRIEGNKVAFEPNRYNAIVSLIGDSEVDNDIDATLTYGNVIITPKWCLLK